MLILSFDCAYKSLAYSLIDFNLNVGIDYDALKQEYDMKIKEFLEDKEYYNMSDEIAASTILELLSEYNEKLEDLCRRSVRFVLWGVKDILNGKEVKKTKINERVLCLKKFVTDLDKRIHPLSVDRVIIEKQMSSGFKSDSEAVMDGLAMHYSRPSDPNFVYIISSSIKTKFSYTPELSIAMMQLKYSSKYSANKAHGKQNFLYFLELMDMNYVRKGIISKELSDLGDTFTQATGYLRDCY